MHKITKLFFLAFLAIVAPQPTIFANNSSNSAYGINSNDRQEKDVNDQESDDADQYTPNMQEERAFMQQSHQRDDRINQQNRSMIQQDRQMMREGYDRNQSTSQWHSNTVDQDQNTQRHPYRVQQQRMSGSNPYPRTYDLQEGDTSSQENGIPQSYPLNDGYRYVPRQSNDYRQQNDQIPSGYQNSSGYNNDLRYNDSSQVNRGTSPNKGTRADWNWNTETDGQNIDQSNTNTSGSSTTKKNVQR